MKIKHFLYLYWCLFNIIAFSSDNSDYIKKDVFPKEHEKWWEKCLNKKMFDFQYIWLGQEDADSRVKMRDYIKQKQYKVILDIPCGLCTEYFGYKKNNVCIDYYGVDITEKLVTRARSLGLNVVHGSIENIPYKTSSMEICYARHILEHLDYYEKAIDELIRVAQREVMIVFFMKPEIGNEKLDEAIVDEAYLYHNLYERIKLEDYVRKNSKVLCFEWQTLNAGEEALHIYLKK